MQAPTQQADVRLMHSDTWKADNQLDSATIPIWVARDDTPLHQVLVSKGTTVGQLAVAEAQLGQLPEPVRPTTAMGSLLSVYKPVTSNQIILIEDGRHQKVTRCPQVQNMTRLEALWTQQGWVATDEMGFYMTMLGQPNLTNTSQPLIIHDRTDMNGIFAHWLNQGIDQFAASQKRHTQHTVCLHDEHWFPVSASFADEGISLTTTLPELPLIQSWTTEALGNACQFHYKVPLEAFPADCGFQALAWIMAQELQTSQAYPMSVEEAIKWRSIFAQHLHNQGLAHQKHFHVMFGGAKDFHLTELSALLQAHGVHADRAASASQQIVQTLGVASVQQTLGSARPWADLKAKASAHNIKLVLAEELQSQIAARLRTGKPIGNRQNKKQSKNQPPKWIAPPSSPSADSRWHFHATRWHAPESDHPASIATQPQRHSSCEHP